MRVDDVYDSVVTSQSFVSRKNVKFDATTVALHECTAVGGFEACFDAALRSLKKGHVLK